LREIGTTTSNDHGTFSFTWAPDIAGDYTVIANFPGSQAYYTSSAATSFYASEATATATPQPTPASSMADLYFIPAIAGLAILGIITLALLVLLMKKKP
jgi:hypothetical protein